MREFHFKLGKSEFSKTYSALLMMKDDDASFL